MMICQCPLPTSSGFSVTNVEIQLLTAVTDLAAFSTTIPLISWYDSQVINMFGVHDMACFVETSTRYKADDMEKCKLFSDLQKRYLLIVHPSN